MEDGLKRAAWTFAQAFLAVWATFDLGILAAPNLATAKATIVATLGAALAAGLSALKNLLIPAGSPAR
jgi:hypothetical protein